jgi:primosomal protein N'
VGASECKQPLPIPDDPEPSIRCSYCGHTYNEELFCYIIRRQTIVEVKPKITDYGETVRQIRTYQSRLPGADAIVFTKDWKFDKDFIKDGITPLHPQVAHSLDEYWIPDSQP